MVAVWVGVVGGVGVGVVVAVVVAVGVVLFAKWRYAMRGMLGVSSQDEGWRVIVLFDRAVADKIKEGA